MPEDWFIPQEQVFKTRETVNKEAGSRRMLAHFTFTPGRPGWLDQVDEAVERFKPDSWKGYTVGDNTHKELAAHPWHADDEKLMYPFYEKIAKTGHPQRLHPQGAVRAGGRGEISAACCRTPMSAISARRRRTGRSSISSSTTRPIAGSAAIRRTAWRSSTRPGAVHGPATSPRSRKNIGVNNVYGDLGQLFAWTSGGASRASSAALMGMLVKGLGPDRIMWGTDAVWTGAPQWQIEGLRRLEIPEDMQKQHGFKPLGPADGRSRPRSSAATRPGSMGLEKHAEIVGHDRFAAMKADYEANGGGRSNLRYGYVTRG